MDSKNITAWPRHRILKALINGKLEPEEVMATLNIRTVMADIGPEALGFIYRRTDGTLIIATSDALSPAAGRRS